MIEITLSKIIIDEKQQEQIIILREKNGSRILPIVIGINEAIAIKLKLSKIEPPRPLTHDLLAKIVEGLGAKLEKVVIDSLAENTFFAKLHFINTQNEKIIIDARPSDSIALAVRLKSPIFVEEEVLQKLDARQ